MKALHDMRIAAKRLRYILEVGAEPCFGPYAVEAIKRTKDLQDLLGELHDCDVQLPRVRALQDELRAADALEARARAGDAPDLDPTLASGTPHAPAWRGLETLRIYVEARRGLLFERFAEMWRELEREGFRARLEYAIGERPDPPTPLSQSDNGDEPSSARSLGSAERWLSSRRSARSRRPSRSPSPSPRPPISRIRGSTTTASCRGSSSTRACWSWPSRRTCRCWSG